MLSFFMVNVAASGAALETEYHYGFSNARMHDEKDPNNKARRKAAAVRRSDRNMKQYRDSKGDIILTNRPEKYDHRRDFVEVSLHYTPIVLTPKYQRITSPAAYTSSNISELVSYYSKLYVLDESLIYAVIRAESDFDQNAVSRCGARGLMQLMPETAADMGVRDVFDPAQNIAGGTQYLAKMLVLFDNRVDLAVAAYNAGPNAVKQYGGIPPYAETQQYVRDVLRFANEYSGGGAKFNYLAKASRPRADSVPDVKKAAYVIHFHSGLTQPVDKIIDEDPYYYVQFGNRTSLVRKEHVKTIEST